MNPISKEMDGSALEPDALNFNNKDQNLDSDHQPETLFNESQRSNANHNKITFNRDTENKTQ